MSKIAINISKKSVMGVVEGLSATIAQHNPDVDFETMWASDSEEPKLDIYYRESITDLENHISKWTSSTSTQYDLQALADDYKLTIKMLAYWPSRLSGLLANKIQDYLVHAIMAGWLNDFPELKTTDYASMGVTDLDSIKEILLKKDFSFVESERVVDAINKEGDGKVTKYTRLVDSQGKNASKNNSFNIRPSDHVSKDETNQSSHSRSLDSDGKKIDTAVVVSRNTEAENKDNIAFDMTSRAAETNDKEQSEINTVGRDDDNVGKDYSSSSKADRHDETVGKDNNIAGASARYADNLDKNLASRSLAIERHKDDARQCFYHEQVDWSGGRPPFKLK